MKQFFKYIIIFAVVLFFTNITFAAKKDQIEVVKENGKRPWYAPWQVRYDYVHFDPCGGSCQTGLLECKRPGSEKCERPFSYNNVNIGGNIYSDELITNIVNEVMDLVDKSIYDGNSCGNVSKKYSVKTSDGKEMLLAFSASWKNANIENGDVKYAININELSIK